MDPDVPVPIAAGVDHAEIDLTLVAGITDRGQRHAVNQDAFTLAHANGRAIFAVCDGVSSSVHPERAARMAADAVMASLAPLLGAPAWPDTEDLVEAVADATQAAERAVRATASTDEPLSATTIVLGAVGPGVSVIGSIGDSRAYWVDEGYAGHRLLTVDDSWAQAAIDQGVPPEQAYASRRAHVITRCLRTDDTRLTPPNVAIVEVAGPGTIVACSDGLWNYAESANDLADTLGMTTDQTPIGMARHLVNFANVEGGIDNITVVVLPVGPEGILPGGSDDRAAATDTPTVERPTLRLVRDDQPAASDGGSPTGDLGKAK